MPVDPTGTTPGLQPAEPAAQPQVHLKCKNQHCDSILAIEVKIAGHTGGGRRLYQCVKCKLSWGIPVGGSVDL
jgi:hypothetical protein